MHNVHLNIRITHGICADGQESAMIEEQHQSEKLVDSGFDALIEVVWMSDGRICREYGKEMYVTMKKKQDGKNIKGAIRNVSTGQEVKICYAWKNFIKKITRLGKKSSFVFKFENLDPGVLSERRFVRNHTGVRHSGSGK